MTLSVASSPGPWKKQISLSPRHQPTPRKGPSTLDEAMLQLEHIAQANKSNTASSVAENDNPDPESQYTASPPNQEDKDTNATPLIVGHRNHSSPNATSFPPTAH
ncbi:hypothetical protein MHU86_23202 [Fragilaria crotonensis]|nr:hypothetical protein MHU86_23202 [Fragilaria crotonensis]